jgi:hypothetical protein
MKTKILYHLAIATMLAGTVFVSCSKNNSSSADSGTSSNTLQTQSDDQSQVTSESNAIADDANVAMSSQPTVSGASALTNGYGHGKTIEGVQSVLTSPVCDATITIDTSKNPRTITLTYNGNANCNPYRIRTGTVVISIPAGTQWRNQGAVITVNFNLKVTRVRDSKTIILTGTHTYTNVSGGSLNDLVLGKISSITHTVTSSNMQITFPDSSKRIWNVARQRAYSFNNQTQDLTITLTGTYSDGTNSGISEWGSTRIGKPFKTVIVNPIVIQSACSWQLTSGEIEVIRPDVMTTVTFGLDNSGNPLASCPLTTYYYKVIWEIGGKSYTVILPY